jgi:hypothetical protein
MTERCFYFGCWNVAGHYLFAPGGIDAFRVIGKETRSIEYYDKGSRHLDGTLAPRRFRHTGEITWLGEHEKDAYGIQSKTEECQQGQFLLHYLDNGFSAIQWWDRCQGDTRGACNSTVLLEGTHTSEEMLAALRKHFPHLLENLERGGPPEPPPHRRNRDWRPPQNQGRIELVELQRPSAPPWVIVD